MVKWAQSPNTVGPMKGRVIALFGAPGIGLSTTAQCLLQASRKSIVCVNISDEGLICALNEIQKHVNQADLVLLDSITSADEVKTLVTEHVIDGVNQNNLIIQIARTGAKLPEIVQADWHARCKQIEDAIFFYGLPYRTIQNSHGDLEAAVGELARYGLIKS